MYALEDDDARFRDVIEKLADARGPSVDIDDAGRTEFLKLAVRVGLQEAASDLLDDAKEAVSRRTEF